jgi:hypothetical protein
MKAGKEARKDDHEIPQGSSSCSVLRIARVVSALGLGSRPLGSERIRFRETISSKVEVIFFKVHIQRTPTSRYVRVLFPSKRQMSTLVP